MAKTTSPLLSMGASGKIGNTMVFFPWKGINAVRQWLVPANPKSTKQTTQRGYMTAFVSKVHEAMSDESNPLNEDDKTAYAKLAQTLGKVATWFNAAAKEWMDTKVAQKTPVVYYGVTFDDLDPDTFGITLHLAEETSEDLADGKFYFGRTPTAMLESATATVTSGDKVELADEDLSSWMTSGNKYYVQFRPDDGDPCEGCVSGIYTFVAA